MNATKLCFQRGVDGANGGGRYERKVLAVIKMTWGLLTVMGGQTSGW